MNETISDVSDDQIYQAYLNGIRGIHPHENEDSLLLNTANAMGFVSRERGDITAQALVVHTARHVLVPAAIPSPADEEGEVAVRRGPGRPPKAVQSATKKKPTPQTSAVRRVAGTKPVACPVPGCQNPGVRPKMNFCNEHADALPKEERRSLRAAQRAGGGESAPVVE
jgi:hypothetical protein